MMSLLANFIQRLTSSSTDAFLIIHPASTDASRTMRASSADAALKFLKIIHLVFILIVCCLPHTGSVGGFQRFEVTPESVEVREGEDVTLQCVVAHQQGRAQWTKDGFALGFQRHVPGYPRYSYLGDPERGQHHLLISSVSLTDDGEYQCQVGPTLTNPPIWAAANLTVLIAPASISLEDHRDGSVLEMVAGDRLTLRCLVSDARPPPSLRWYKAGRQVDPAQVESYVVASSLLPHRWSVRSQLVRRVAAQDDGEDVSCRAVHPALDDEQGLTASLTLSVQHPPDPPVITGYETGEVLVAGEHRTLTCRAPGGNPRPSVLWYRAGHLLDDTYARDASGTVNTLQVGVTTVADGDQYECRVDSDLLEHPLATNVTLTVHYPPSLVSLTGSSWVEAGGSFSLQCETTESNPPATLTWLVQGEAVGSPAAVVRRGSSGGWVTRSRLVWQVASGRQQQQREDDRLLVECRTQHPALRDALRKTMLLTVTKPVGAPEFEGDPSKEVVAGTSLDLICSIQGSQPPPSIRIFKNGRLVPAEVVHEGAKSSARGGVEVTAADNGSEVKCEVTSPASETPRVTSARLSVLFPPGEVTGSALPRTAEEGTVVNLSCQTASSFPPANITWRSEGVSLQGAVAYSTPAAFGGSITRSQLQVRVTAADDGRTYSCEGSNVLGSSVREEMTLNVLHGPVWLERPSSQLVVREGSQLVIRARASANPGPVRYWWKRGPEVLVGAGGELRLGRLTKDHAGNYTVNAYSQRGAVNASFFLNVQYGPEVVEAPERVTVDEGDSVNLQCTARGDPTPHLTWTRRNRTLASGDGAARLMLTSVRRNDTDVYYCRATSPLGTPPPATTKLIVTQPVVVAEDVEDSRGSWAALGGDGRLVCHVRAAPTPTFVWSTEDGREIHSDGKYTVRRPEATEGLVLWRSVLEVRAVAGGDFGLYRCFASNALGSDATHLTLNPPTRPHTPANLTVVNVSNGSVVLGWSSSSSSEEGKPLSFTVRSRAAGTLLYQYVDIPEGSSTRARVTGLSPGMQYNFSVQAKSDQGSSDFSIPPITVTTLGTAGAAAGGPGGGAYHLTGLLLLGIVMSAMALLVLNVAIIACILRRHKRRNNSIRSSSTKTTSLATHGNSPTSSPEDHQHHHHHHVIMTLDKGSPKVGRQTNKGAGKHTGLVCPASPGKKGSAGKHTKVFRKSHGPFMSNGRIPQGGHILTKQNKKNDSTFSQNRSSGNGKTSNHKKGRFHPLVIPEACSLIPKTKENRLSQERNSGEDDDQTSVSSHESVDTAIFCSSTVRRSFPSSGEQQEPSPVPQGQRDNAPLHAHPNTDEEKEEEEEASQQYQQSVGKEVQRQQLQENLPPNPKKQTTHGHSVTGLSDLHHSTSQYQGQHYHKTYTPGGPGPDSSPHSWRHSSSAHVVPKNQPDRHGPTQTTATDGKPFHNSSSSLSSAKPYHPPPDSPSRTHHQCHPPPDSPSRTHHQCHPPPDSPSRTHHQCHPPPDSPSRAHHQCHPPPDSPITHYQHHPSPESPSRFQQQRQPPASSSRIQQRHPQPPSPPTKPQHRHLPPDSPTRAQTRRLPPNSPTRMQQHHPLTRTQHRRTPPPSPTSLQQHHLPPDSSPSRSQRYIPHESPTRTQRLLPPESPSRVQHRPPPVPPKRSSQHRPPSSPSKVGYQQTQVSPRLRRKFPPSTRPSSAQYSPTPSSHMNLQQQSPRYSIPPSPKAPPYTSEVPRRTFHHEFPYYELVYPPGDVDPKDIYQRSSTADYSSQQNTGQDERQLPHHDRYASQETIVSPAMPSAVQTIRDTHAPMATSSPIRNPRRPRFPDDFLWQGTSDKL